MSRGRKPRIVAILALPGVQLLDICGPSRRLRRSQRAGSPRRLISCGSSAPAPDRSAAPRVRDCCRTSSSATAAPGGKQTPCWLRAFPTPRRVSPDARILDWLRKIVPTTGRYGSVCSGAFFLAAAGLLDGRRVTTHWAVADRLAAAFPSVMIDADAIHVRDGRVRTAAGVTAGLDLALALVEEDLGSRCGTESRRAVGHVLQKAGRPTAIQPSRRNRPGRSVRIAGSTTLGRGEPRPAARHPEPRRAHEPQRPTLHATFHAGGRNHTRGVGVEQARISAARTLLESGEAPPKQVASLCGFAMPTPCEELLVATSA